MQKKIFQIFAYFTVIVIYFPLIQCQSKYSHEFIIVPTTNSFSLDNQEFIFIHKPNENERYHIAFQGIFPIPTYFEIDNLSPFVLRAETLCSSCLINNYLQVFKGDLFKCSIPSKEEGEKFLSSIYVEITNKVYGKALEKRPTPTEKDQTYILLTNVEKGEKTKTVVFMKEQYLGKSTFFQILKTVMTVQTEGEFSFKVGDEFTIDNGEYPMKNGVEYSSMIYKEKIVTLQFDEINSIICLSKEKDFAEKCTEV